MTIALGLTPLLVAVVLLVGLQRPSREVGLVMLVVTILIVLFLPPFRLPATRVGQAMGEGAATALTVAAILFPALLFYQTQKSTGAITRLSQAIAALVPDRTLQVLLLVLGIGPAVEAMCGFGVGAVVIIPLLASLETDKLKITRLSLFSQLLCPWGALGIAMLFAAQLSGLRLGVLSTLTALLLAPISIGFALLALYVAGGNEALLRYWPVALATSCLQIGGIILGSRLLGVELSAVVASMLVIILLVLWGKNFLRPLSTRRPAYPAPVQEDRQGEVPLIRALVPYLLLMASLFATHLVPVVRDWLQAHGVLTLAAIKLHFAVLYSPGVCLLVAALAPIFLSRQRDVLLRAATRAGRQFVPAAMALVCFLAAAALLQDGDITGSLGGAAAALGKNYLWIASLVGGIGGWLTGSVLGGNALCIPLQIAASAHAGLPLPWIISTQIAATGVASMVSPARLILVISASGAVGREGALLRKTGPTIIWAIALIVFLLAWFVTSALLTLLLVVLLLTVPPVLVALRSDRWIDISNVTDFLLLPLATRLGKEAAGAQVALPLQQVVGRTTSRERATSPYTYEKGGNGLEKQRQEPPHAADESRDKSLQPSLSPYPAFSERGDLHATLAVNEPEARSGTSRSIRLPGSQQMSVVVPAGAYEGQVLELVGLGNPAVPGRPRGTLTLTITILPAKATGPLPRREQSTARPFPRFFQKSRALLLIGLVLLLALGGVGSMKLLALRPRSAGTTAALTPATHTPLATRTALLTPTAATVTVAPMQASPPGGLSLAGTYNGSMFDQTTQQLTYISVVLVQSEGNAALSGMVTFKSPSQGVYPLHGTVDPHGNFSFTVQLAASQAPLHFYGAVEQQQGSYLKGEFCRSSTNACSVNTGYFLVGPQ